MKFYKFEILINDLQKEVSLYQELFGNSETVGFLNKTCPNAFAIFQKSMFFEIICRLSAIFDPSKTGRDSNLTLDYLMECVEGKVSKDTFLEVESVKYDFKKTGVKKFRNKVYGHFDLKFYLGKGNLETDITYEGISELLKSLAHVVRKLGIESGKIDPEQQIYRNTTVHEGSNGKALLKILRGS